MNKLFQEKTPLHVFNTQFFENKNLPKHFKELQYLPLLYANSNETVYIDQNVCEDYLKQLNQKKTLPSIIREIPKGKFYLESWENDKSSVGFAKQYGLDFHGCDPKITSYYAKKSTCNHLCQTPKGCEILDSLNDLKSYLSCHSLPVLLKEDSNFSGLGHFVILNNTLLEEAFRFFEQALTKGKVLAQPLFQRVLDFSTQWEISKDKKVTFLGETWLLNTQERGYKGTLVGCELSKKFGWHDFLMAHLNHSYPLLNKMALNGFWGSVGLDSFIYFKDHELQLFPIVEINPRKTMGKVALNWWKGLANTNMGLMVRQNKDHLGNGYPLTPKKLLWFYENNGEERAFFEKIRLNYASSFENFYKLL